MLLPRKNSRVNVNLPVTITSVLSACEAMIVDLSERGAQIRGIGLSIGTPVQIEYGGQVVFARSCWAEVDRMGVEFHSNLADGPLKEYLLAAQEAQAWLDQQNDRWEPVFGRKQIPGKSIGQAA